ncbi:MAG: hypothetical protein KKE02_07080 [Alphaproteobacteria bacterium]|nr:hypothetical protein [Alphaproteobacteria bacterium]MBU1515526.1 hypothetical protein [Alphaproteobacteria bacterium]MBU2095524.1 hypothetical protein [Alphaproteobacteria bacterium]MBU2150765.1 hypothetical protein [Alphaproteobacteria bacterium]MBU2307030.1 hypothetical protein [Alphaproteobacteria bacterium]
MLASLLVLLALAGQPTPPDDGPVQTAPKERPVADAPLPGLDEQTVDIPAVVETPPEPATTEPTPPPPAESVPEPKAAPAAVAAAKALTIDQKTVVQGETLQVVLGQRAVFRLDAKGLPVLETVEEGKLAAAHPEGAVTETFAPPPQGQIAIALDGSAEARATILKVWNQTDKPIDYRAIALVMSQGRVTPTPAPVCAVLAGGVRTETWRRPIVAVGLGRFQESTAPKDCQ